MNIPRYWRAQNQRYSLAGEICKQCGARLFPPRDVCPECRELALAPFAFDPDDEIYPLLNEALEIRGEGAPQAVSLVNSARWRSSRTCSAPAERETSFATPAESSYSVKLRD